MMALIWASLTPAGSDTVMPLGNVRTAPFAAALSGRPPGVEAPKEPRPAPLSAAGAGSLASCSWTLLGSRPSTRAAEPTSRGVRSAAFWTASTLSAWPMWISTSALIPGRSSPCRFAMWTCTGNIVTFCTVSALGSILITVPSNGWLG